MRTEQSILHIYPVGQKFRRNRSISHSLGNTSNCKFYHFCQKFENSKWLPFLKRGKFFFEKWAEYLALILAVVKERMARFELAVDKTRPVFRIFLNIYLFSIYLISFIHLFLLIQPNF